MSKNEEIFKQQLNDVFSSREFEMSTADWAGMEILLNKEKKKRRAIIFFFSGAGIALLSLVIWLLASPVTLQKRQFANQEQAQTNQTLTIKNPIVSAEQNTTAKTNTAKPIQGTKKSTRGSSPKDARPLTNSSNAPETPATSAGSIPDAAPAIPNVPNNAVLSVTETMPTGSEQNNTPVIANSQLPSLTPTPQQSIVTANDVPTETVDQNATVKPVMDSVVAPTASTSLAVAEKKDTIAAPVLKPDTDYVATKQLRYWLEGGANWMTGWNDNTKRDASGFNPLAGLHLSYPLTGDIELFAGLQYYTVGHLKNSKYTATVTRLDLGRIDQATQFTPQRLHYLSLPLQLSYKLDPKQHIGIGVNLAYLLTADSKVESYTYDYFGKTSVEVSKAKGYTQGFRDFDAQLCLIYRRRLYTRFYAQATLFYGLTDVKTGVALPSNSFERNSGVRISLNYLIFNK